MRLRPHDTLLEPTLLRRELWSCDAPLRYDAIGAVRTGLATPLPSIPQSAPALLNRPEPFRFESLRRLPRTGVECAVY
ncbi:MAG: hypothetical protein ACK4P5_04735 [Fimbriimonadales bacterium]